MLTLPIGVHAITLPCFTYLILWTKDISSCNLQQNYFIIIIITLSYPSRLALRVLHYNLNLNINYGHNLSWLYHKLIYVVDMIISGNDAIGIKELKLISHFRMKDLGYLTYFLGLEVSSTRKGINIHRRKCAQDFLSLANLTDDTKSIKYTSRG